MTRLSRRSFLRHAAVAGAAIAVAPAALARPPSDELRVACVGIRSRGRAHIDAFRKLEGVRVVALCDVDRKVLEARAAKLAEAGNPVETYVDLRDLLAKCDVDAISLATPNHLHALHAIWAVEAGKHVYVEKPVSHNVWEGRQIVRAARKHDRLVQTGTQARSSVAIQQAIAWLQAGNLGKIQVARGLCYKPRQSIGKVAGPQVVPAHIDYDLWVGPTPLVPLHRRQLHYDWHWDFHTGCGDVGNQGIHQMDIARWALGESGLAPRVSSIGGRVGYDDDGNTPNTQVVLHDYASAPLVFEVRGLPRSSEFHAKGWNRNMDDLDGVRIGVLIHCEGGSLRVTSNYGHAAAFDPEGKLIQEWKGAGNHFGNFVDAVRSGKREHLNADIEEGHISSALCHLGNISHRIGEAATAAELSEGIVEGTSVAEAFSRMRTHLEANSIGADAPGLVRGAILELDPKAESIHTATGGNNQIALARNLLRRNDREPFVVPEVHDVPKVRER